MEAASASWMRPGSVPACAIAFVVVSCVYFAPDVIVVLAPLNLSLPVSSLIKLSSLLCLCLICSNKEVGRTAISCHRFSC